MHGSLVTPQGRTEAQACPPPVALGLEVLLKLRGLPNSCEAKPTDGEAAGVVVV